MATLFNHRARTATSISSSSSSSSTSSPTYAKILVFGLPRSTSAAEVEDLFRDFGRILTVAKDPGKTTAKVAFEDEESAVQAKLCYDGVYAFGTRSVPVTIGLVRRKRIEVGPGHPPPPPPPPPLPKTEKTVPAVVRKRIEAPPPSPTGDNGGNGLGPPRDWIDRSLDQLIREKKKKLVVDNKNHQPRYKSVSSSPAAPPANVNKTYAKLIITGILPTTSRAEVEELFGGFGHIVSLSVDHVERMAKVAFDDEGSAQEAKLCFQGVVAFGEDPLDITSAKARKRIEAPA